MKQTKTATKATSHTWRVYVVYVEETIERLKPAEKTARSVKYLPCKNEDLMQSPELLGCPCDTSTGGPKPGASLGLDGQPASLD